MTAAEKWNGSTWALVSSPDRGANDNDLHGASSPAPTFCAGVGEYNNGMFNQTLIEHWQVRTPRALPVDMREDGGT